MTCLPGEEDDLCVLNHQVDSIKDWYITQKRRTGDLIMDQEESHFLRLASCWDGCLPYGLGEIKAETPGVKGDPACSECVWCTATTPGRVLLIIFSSHWMIAANHCFLFRPLHQTRKNETSPRKSDFWQYAIPCPQVVIAILGLAQTFFFPEGGGQAWDWEESGYSNFLIL